MRRTAFLPGKVPSRCPIHMKFSDVLLNVSGSPRAKFDNSRSIETAAMN
jgi:hypothetical protein